MNNTCLIITKHRWCFLLLASGLLLLASCKKDEDDNNNQNPPPNDTIPDNPPPEGNSLVTSWSPAIPYPDDDITFYGGPFQTTAGATTVNCLNREFVILSVTSNQLKVRPPADFADDIPAASAGNFHIQNGNNADTLAWFSFKRPLEIRSFEDNVDQPIWPSPARVADSVVFEGSGFTLSGMTVRLNGTDCGPVTVDSAYYGLIGFRIPLSMASGSNEADLNDGTLTVTNADGKSYATTISYAPTPDMQIQGVELMGSVSMSISQLMSNGQVLNFRIYGRYLNASAQWNLSGPSPASGNLVENYSSDQFIVMSPGSMQPGNYTFSVSQSVAQMSFTLTE